MQANADKGQTQLLLLKQQKNFSRKGRKRGQRTPKKPVITNSRHSGAISGIQPQKTDGQTDTVRAKQIGCQCTGGQKENLQYS